LHATFFSCIRQVAKDNFSSSGRKRCCAGRITIHISVINNTASHKGVDNGKSTMKVDGDGVA